MRQVSINSAPNCVKMRPFTSDPSASERRDAPVKTIRLLTALFVSALFVLSVYAQDSAKKSAAPNPAASQSAGLLKQWNEIGRKLIAMSEDYPEDKYDTKAAPTVGTFAQRLIHAAAANYYFTNLANGQKA